MIIDEIFQSALLKAYKVHAGWDRLGKSCGVTWQTINKWSKPEYLGKDVKNSLANKVIDQLKDEYFPKNWTKERWLNERANIVIIKKDRPLELSENESRLLRHFHFLNQEMKDRLLSYAGDLVELQLKNDRENLVRHRHYSSGIDERYSYVAEDSKSDNITPRLKQSKRPKSYSENETNPNN